MPTKEKILVTAALPYANGNIHLGHLAGAYLPADVYVRYHRLKGNDIVFICGSDEHGVPITITADKEGLKPKDIIDRFHTRNKEAFEKFGMSFDIYSRTSQLIHHETAKEFFLDFFNRGLLNEHKSRQFYDEKAQMFLPDRYVEGTCPKCGYDQARSDECENCGSLYDPSDLQKPVSKITGMAPVLKETSHWYFPLGDFQEKLVSYIDEMNVKYGWKDNVLQYCSGWFKDGLKERAVTRDLDWGIPVPLENAQGKVLYVWFEAVLGYISATKELGISRNQPDLWKQYWQGDDTKYVAFIGKDNVVFHCVVFPAMLMAWNEGNAGKYILPQNVPANEFLNYEGLKFSKSRGWGIDLQDFLGKYNADSLRYTLALNLPELRDTDFYWKDFQARHNNELADILGNFINRTLTFVGKHFENKVPPIYQLEERDKGMLELLERYPEKIASLIESYKIKEASLETMNLARAANKYFNDSEPWRTIRSDREKCASTLNICVQTIYTLAELFQPFIPFTSEKIFRMLNVSPTDWDNCGRYTLNEGHLLNKPEILFVKIEDSAIDSELDSIKDATKRGEKEPAEETITIEDFDKIRLRVVEVISAENIKGADKLLKLRIFDGYRERQIVAGIAKFYDPEQLKGKKVIIVSNLKPAKLRGIESQGMLLAAETIDGELKVVHPDDNSKIGSRVK
ncbi:MAG: methionine--tRNA ligase [Ignavibacteriaceae bacterium]|nr:methionine--tRNA ligase [Ignavibacteriaceae bacterium]